RAMGCGFLFFYGSPNSPPAPGGLAPDAPAEPMGRLGATTSVLPDAPTAPPGGPTCDVPEPAGALPCRFSDSSSGVVASSGSVYDQQAATRAPTDSAPKTTAP